MRKLLLAIIVLFSSLAFGQGQFAGGGASFPPPGSAGLCWVSTSATAYTWGSCSGSTSANWSALVPGTGTLGAGTYNVGTGSSLLPTGSGVIAATKWNIARSLAGNSVDGSADVTFANKYILQGTADAGLPNAQFLGALNTCLIKNTTVTGVLSCGVSGTDYVSPQTTLSGYGITDAVPSSRTINGKALSANVTLGLASADFANQGTTTTVYHGNAAGNPAFGGIVIADITDKLGTGTKVVTTSATAPASAKCTEMDTSGNIVIAASNAACGSGGSGMTNPMTTLADLITGGAAGAPTRLAGPTAVNGVPQTLTSTPSGGAAVAPVWTVVGVGTNAQTGTTYTVAATDRTSYLSFSNAGAVTVTLPQAGSTGFASNFAFDTCAIGVGTVTIQPTTSTISYSTGTAYSSGQTSMPLTTGQCAFIYSDNTNYFAFQIQGGGGGGVTSISGGTGPVTNSGSTGGVTLTWAGTSGGIPYWSSASAMSSSGVLNLNVLPKGGGAGGAPTNSLTTDDGTTSTYTGTGGTKSPVFTATGTTSGFVDYPQGPTSTAVAPCNTANSICEQAPAAVTSYLLNKVGAAANGIKRWANSANVVTESISELSGDAATSGSNAVIVSRMNGVAVLRVVMTADWTCGTGGTSSSCTAATIVGTGGTPLTITLPSVTASYHWQCDGVVGQATAATANNWNVITATNAPTNMEATYQMNTAAAVSAGGALTGASAITTQVIGGAWTLGGTATKMPFHVQGSIEGASASGTVISLQLVAPTVADLVTVYRGTSCSVAPF